MSRMEATTLAVITNRCTDMMQAAAVAYYSNDEGDQKHHTEVVFVRLRDLAQRLGFEVVKPEPAVKEAAE